MDDKMRTAKKLAIFFTSIPREQAIGIMRHFSMDTMEAVASEIRALGQVTPDMQSNIFTEISQKLAGGVSSQGGDSVAAELIKGVVGEEEARKLLERAQPRKPKPFSTISHISGQDLATMLSNEQSSTASIVLSYLPPKKTAEVLKFLDEEFREEVVLRLAQSRETDSEIVDRIESIFVARVSSSTSPHDNKEEEKNSVGGPDFVAEVFLGIDKDTEDELLSALQEESPETAEKIRDLMFTFDDIINLTDSDIQKVLREVPTDKLVLALRGASPELFSKFTDNLSKRAKENLQEEMELMGKVKKSEIDVERKVIVGIIRALEAAGEISLGMGDDADEYI